MAHNFCLNCGARLDSGARFCPSCGQPIQQSLSEETTIPQSLREGPAFRRNLSEETTIPMAEVPAQTATTQDDAFAEQMALKAEKDNKKKNTIIIAVAAAVAVLLLVGGTTAFFLLRNKKSSNTNQLSDVYYSTKSNTTGATTTTTATTTTATTASAQVYNGPAPTYQDASTRMLSGSELAGMTSRELSLLRNEIYARHGYIFQRDDLYNHFSQFSWYYPYTSSQAEVRAEFNIYERENVNLIKSYEH